MAPRTAVTHEDIIYAHKKSKFYPTEFCEKTGYTGVNMSIEVSEVFIQELSFLPNDSS